MFTPLRRLRIVAILEGISYLVLLGIAMPLKYLAGEPLAVEITGWFHGVFFILFVGALLQVAWQGKWKLMEFGLGFVASLLPFGTFVLDRKLKRLESGSLS